MLQKEEQHMASLERRVFFAIFVVCVSSFFGYLPLSVWDTKDIAGYWYGLECTNTYYVVFSTT